ncbi:hypothetical protein EZS27_020024 [termite gut metagenome]|uniref:RagB/SusD family nutrient uptake outer membrane protein n=1 Tax=termite gut metagenome TaxID=433724 RepID=A0A5J4RD02_9ZZZZ
MKTKYVLLISCISATLTLCFSSCENDFDAKIYGSLSTTNFPATEDDYIDLLMTCYLPFTANWGYDLYQTVIKYDEINLFQMIKCCNFAKKE